MKNPFHKWLYARRVAKYIQMGNRMARINAQLDRIDGESEDAELLRAERARCWQRRNDLALKLTQE